MAYSDFSKAFTLHTDASKEGFGAVLYQNQDGVMKVIVYASRALSPTEKKYHLHTGKLEFLALKWAVTEQFCDDLYYSPKFTVFMDNNPLTYILTSAKLNATAPSNCSSFPFYGNWKAADLSGKIATVCHCPTALTCLKQSVHC